MQPRVLITGIDGFAGTYLAEVLLEKGQHVEGLCRAGGTPVQLAHLSGRVPLHHCDLSAFEGVAEAIRWARPDTVYHLAAMTSVPAGENAPRQMLDTNFLGTMNLAEAMRQEAPRAALIFISSSEVYGRVPPEDNPVTERQPLAPIHFYGFSKLMAERLLRFYQRAHDLSVILLRPFNHIGPRQSDAFVCSSFAKQIAWIQKGRQDPILHVGNLEPQRDFTDVRDMVRAYGLAPSHCKPGTAYNIATGRGVPISQVLEILLSFTDVAVEIRRSDERFRKSEIPILTGNASRFRRATEWAPRVPLEQSLWDTYTYWMEQ